MNNFQLTIHKLISLVVPLILAVAVFNCSTFAEESSGQQTNNQLADDIKSKLINPLNSEAVSEDLANDTTGQTQVEFNTLIDQINSSETILNSNNEIGEIARIRRELIRLDLEHQKVVLEAKIAEVVNANSRDAESDDFVPELARLIEKLEEQRNNQTDLLNNYRSIDPLPVVAEIVGSAGHLEARLLVPYFGEVIARIGMVLPNGMKVFAITPTKVLVTMNGESQMLPFGTVVSAGRSLDQTVSQNITRQ